MENNRINLESGGFIDVVNVEASEFTLEDIARGLASKCRFSGHVPVFYSVAQHSVNVSNIAGDRAGMVGLLHDAAEAFMADLPTPYKDVIQGWRGHEAALQRLIYSRLGINETEVAEWRDFVKDVDSSVFLMERAVLWQQPIKIKVLSRDEAIASFIARYEELVDIRAAHGW